MTSRNILPPIGICYWCSSFITNQKTIGTTRKFCSVKCSQKFHGNLSKIDKRSWNICINEGCDSKVRIKSAKYCNPCYRVIQERRAGICTVRKCNKPATRVGHGLCENHYTRVRKTGMFDLQPRVEIQTTKGYKIVKAETHPLSMANGWAFEHRIVAYEKYGPGIQKCHWDGVELTWNQVVVDHLNEDKLDNRPDNLVTACNSCNLIRGAMIPFIRKMTDEKLAHLIQTFGYMRQTQLRCEEV